MLKLYNTMSRSKEAFHPLNEGVVKIFTCGPSTYRRPHVGNYRTFLYEDILVRYLEYLGYDVRRIINFTDVEDKMLEEAVALGRKPEQIAKKVADHFFAETEILNIKLPPKIPRASTSIAQAVRLIKELLKKGLAYWHEGKVFFDPLKFKDFGKLFRLDMSKWPKKKVRFKKDTYNGRRWNRGDFVLWHGYNDGDLSSWETEIGRGRPSWNIQDPAMVTENLGFQIDINCGGIDNIYRHHDYNIAIIESLSGKQYARFYLHGEHLIIDGKTMSKSRGNILYPGDILNRHFQPHHLRFFLIQTHYRKKLNLTDKKFKQTAEYIDSIRSLARKLVGQTRPGAAGDAVDGKAGKIVDAVTAKFEKYMNDDLSVGRAVEGIRTILLEMEKCCFPLDPESARRLAAALGRIDTVLQVLLDR
ncbi:MAG: class I tRNA ligase family protein [Spirochaetaceae bacterium]|nr:MAG: class I tRNA ligase family protein [Spirochaetaceae bacterium]